MSLLKIKGQLMKIYVELDVYPGLNKVGELIAEITFHPKYRAGFYEVEIDKEEILDFTLKSSAFDHFCIQKCIDFLDEKEDAKICHKKTIETLEDRDLLKEALCEALNWDGYETDFFYKTYDEVIKRYQCTKDRKRRKNDA